jgi:hypothetical protein
LEESELTKKKETNFVYLAGGLGNQLSQLSFAMSQSHNLVLKCVTQKKSFKFVSGNMSISDNVKLEYEPKLNWIQEKYVHLYLREAGKRQTSKNLNLALQIIKQFSLLLLPARISTLSEQELASSKVAGKNRGGKFLVGYFQNKKFLVKNKINSFVDSLLTAEQKKLLEPFIQELQKKVLIVHVRLGDYSVDPRLGIRPPSYYRKAIELAHQLEIIEEIWFFSNDTELAKKVINFDFGTKMRWLEEEITLNASEMLYLIKHATRFVISNSTLSWWGAVLSDKPTFVAAPSVWYENEEEFEQMLFGTWHIVKD